MPEELQTQDPTGGEVMPEQVETEVGEPTSPEDYDEIADLQAKVDTATSDEERAAAVEKRNVAFARMRRERKEALDAKEKEALYAAHLKGKVEALESMQYRQPVQTAQPEPEPEVPLPSRPDARLWTDAEGYEDQDKKTEALADWRAECKLIERDARLARETALKDQQKQAEDQLNWERAGESKFPGFKDKVVARLRPALMNVPRQKAMDFSIAVSESPLSHEIAVYLADNQDDLNRLLAMSTPSALREIGKLEDKLEKPKPPTKTSAPAPIKPVTTGEAKITSLEDIVDDEEYFVAVKKKRIQERLARRG